MKNSRNNRVVLRCNKQEHNVIETKDVIKVAYTAEYATCFRGEVLKCFNVSGEAKFNKKDKEFDEEFGVKLARARAEYNAYDCLRLMIVLNELSLFKNVMSYVKLAYINLITYEFSRKMCKHQLKYIHKLIKTKYANK